MTYFGHIFNIGVPGTGVINRVRNLMTPLVCECSFQRPSLELYPERNSIIGYAGKSNLSIDVFCNLDQRLSQRYILKS